MKGMDPTFAEIDRIIAQDAPIFARMVGVPGFKIRIERPRHDEDDLVAPPPAVRWDAASRELSVDRGAFLKYGYSGEEIVYAILVEVLGNLRPLLVEPRLAADLERFLGLGDHAVVFHGVLSSLAASRRAHAALPRWERVGQRVYRERLYPEEDYLDYPLHLQFLYKVARQQMIPGSETLVAPGVDDLLAEFHDYLGTGRDLVAYSTQPARSATEQMSVAEQFSIWTRNIYPRWIDLIDRDLRGSSARATRRVSAGERTVATHAEESRADFADYYREHRARREHRNRHHSEQEELRRAALRPSRDEQSNPALLLDAQLRAQTGHGEKERRHYAFEVHRYREQVDEIRGLYRELLHSHLYQRRVLRAGRTEGAVLSPERLAQTMIEMRTGVAEPRAFSDYEAQPVPRDHAGRADYVFAFDRSGSMTGEKSVAATGAAIICLEAFAGMHRDAQELAARTGIDLDVDVRCAIFTFNDTVTAPKQLSAGLTLKERLDTISDLRAPGGGNADTHVLQAILDFPPAPDRARTLVVVSDGEADDPELARSKVEQLRRAGWRVYGISIGSEAAVELYAPHSRRVDDAALVPAVMRRLIEETF